MKRLSFENIDLTEFDKTAEKEKLNWLSNLNSIRNKASHPTREPISEDEYNLVHSLGEWLKKN